MNEEEKKRREDFCIMNDELHNLDSEIERTLSLIRQDKAIQETD